MPIRVRRRPTFSKTYRHLSKLQKIKINRIFKTVAEKGVRQLSKATPKDTSQTANSWSYRIQHTNSYSILYWSNSVMAGKTPLVILLRYGHGTGTGGYVPGRDFMGPIVRDLYKELRQRVRDEVT